MDRQSRKPPSARVSGWGATGNPDGKRRLLTSAQYAELRRKLADVEVKLRQTQRGRARAAALIRGGPNFSRIGAA